MAGFFQELENTITKTGNAASQKARDFAETNRLNGEMSRLTTQRNTQIATLGQMLYDYKKGGDDAQEPDYDSVIASIDEIDAQVYDLETRLGELKGMIRCPQCKKLVPQMQRTCNLCGAELPPPPIPLPPQGMPPQGMPPQGMPPQGMPPQGAAPQMAPASCAKCGKPLAPGAKFCTGCGTPVTAMAPAAPADETPAAPAPETPEAPAPETPAVPAPETPAAESAAPEGLQELAENAEQVVEEAGEMTESVAEGVGDVLEQVVTGVGETIEEAAEEVAEEVRKDET